MLDLLADPQTWLAFVTLSLLEIILGVRQHHLHLDPGRAVAARAPGVSADHRARSGDADTHRLAVLDCVAHRPDDSRCFMFRDQGVSGRDLILSRRRAVSARQECARNSSHAGRSRPADGTGAAGLREFHHDRAADRRHRRRLLTRLGVYRCRAREGHRHHGGGHRRLDPGDDVGREIDRARSSTAIRRSRCWRSPFSF